MLKFIPITFISATMPNTGGWKDRHMTAIGLAMTEAPYRKTSHASALVHAIAAWINYAEAHQERFESHIGEDSFLGPVWAKWGQALLGLLNGESGALDCGTLDSIIRDNLALAGLGDE